MSSQPDKRKCTTLHRTCVAFEPPGESGPSTDLLDVAVREERVQPSTGRKVQAARSLVVDIPWLPAEDTEIGLDRDDTKTSEAIAAEFVEIQERDEERLQSEKRRKKRKKKVIF